MEKIKVISIETVFCQDQLFQKISKFTNLTTLKLTTKRQITKKDFLFLQNIFKNLKILEVSILSEEVTEEVLSNAPKLEIFKANHFESFEEELPSRKLKFVSRKIKYFGSICSRLSSSTLQEIFSQFKTLHVLDLSKSLVDFDFINYVLKRFRKIYCLYLNHCPNMNYNKLFETISKYSDSRNLIELQLSNDYSNENVTPNLRLILQSYTSLEKLTIFGSTDRMIDSSLDLLTKSSNLLYFGFTGKQTQSIKIAEIRPNMKIENRN